MSDHSPTPAPQPTPKTCDYIVDIAFWKACGVRAATRRDTGGTWVNLCGEHAVAYDSVAPAAPQEGTTPPELLRLTLEVAMTHDDLTEKGHANLVWLRDNIDRLLLAAAPKGGTAAPPDKRTAGLYGKYKVTRTDGTDAPGMKHDACEYFVLDLTHDPFAIPAIRAYAAACADEYPALAADLLRYAKVGGLAAIIPEYFGEQKR